MPELTSLALNFLFVIGTVVTSSGLALSWQFPGKGRRYAIGALLLTLGFCLLDGLWLQLLIWLKQSYGPISLTWMVLVGIRLSIFLIWILSWRIGFISVEEKLITNRLSSGLWMCLGVNGLLLIVGLYAFYVEPFWLTTSRIQIETSKIPTGQQLRVVQISDIHIERMTRREYALIRQVNALQPDIITLTGDYPNLSNLNDVVTWDSIQYVVSNLKAKYGVFLVDGSNEDPAQVKQLAQDTQTIALSDQVYPLDWDGGRIYLLGVSDQSFHKPPVENFKQLYHQIPAGSLVVLLHHTPDLMKSAGGVDLYLAGHTHGGQIRLPIYGAVFTSSIFYKEYEMGLYHENNTWLYVNRGVGMEGAEAPRARFLAPPEIAVFDLKGKD